MDKRQKSTRFIGVSVAILTTLVKVTNWRTAIAPAARPSALYHPSALLRIVMIAGDQNSGDN